MSLVSTAPSVSHPSPTTLPTSVPVRLGGWGTALPARRVTNHDLAQHLDTSHDWIVERSGIHERRWVGPGETTRTLATSAARAALAESGLTAADIGAVVVATTTPETPLPSTASQVAADLGVTGGAFDVNAACAGFVYALVVGSGLLSAGVAGAVVVVGAETMSSILDKDDRSTAVLFGDGAAATVLVADRGLTRGDARRAPSTSDRGGREPADLRLASAAVPGLVASDLAGDPQGVDLLVVPAGGSARPASHDTVDAGEHHLRMDGREVFRRAVRAVEASIGRTLDRAGVRPDEVDLFVPHQANARIVDAVLSRTGLSAERTSSSIDRYGNTSAASIPIALAEAATAGTVADGDLVLLCGFGAGLTVGTALWRWGTPMATAGAPTS